MVSSSQQANNPADGNSSGFINASGDRNDPIDAVYVAIGGVLKQLDLADGFYTTINGKNLATKKSDIVTALEAIS